jgi:CheY-like chemotaxis protein
MSEQLRPILAAEDEESDRLILELAFERAQLAHPLVIVPDGQVMVEYLSGEGRYADRSAHPIPALLVLDLKMPGMSGFDVLAWLAERSEFKKIPVAVLSSSADESDMKEARQLGAREYFVKPHSLGDLVKIAQEMQARWLTTTATDGPDFS